LPEPWNISEIETGGTRYKVVSGKNIFQGREKVLLAVDSILFELRVYLELLSSRSFGTVN
jgi:hypothetical protein